MAKWSEEWMEQLIEQASRDVPVPVPANLKESILQSAAGRQQVSARKKIFFYNVRLCVSACMALALLGGTAAGIQAQDKIQVEKPKSGWLKEFQNHIDGFASEINTRMNVIVSGINVGQNNMGGKEL